MRWIGDQIVAAHAGGQAPHWADIAVLTRRNADIAPLYAELTARDVPVEIVGLGGLLHLPEVVDVTATLRLVARRHRQPRPRPAAHGPALAGGPAGPRAARPPGARAGAASAAHGAVDGLDDAAGPDVLADLSDAVAGVDPTEVVSLLDALENPGDEPYAPQARERFARLAGELAYLRRHGDEPLLDLTRRIIVTLGLDVELVATREFEQSNRRDQLGTFLDAVADYVDVDGEASLAGLLAYFQAEIDQGAGLEQAVPSDREAVKLLTVHKAKGLEWEVVFLPALMKGVFPSDRVTDNWVTNPAVLPADLRGDAGSIPQLEEATNAGLASYKAELTRQQLLAEDRLAYVAVTRARQLLVGTGHYWRADLSRPRTPSVYLQAILAEAARQGEVVVEATPSGPDNPLVTAAAPQPWPKPLDPEAWARRQAAAASVEAARRRHARTGSYEPPGGGEQLLLDDEEVVAGWDSDIAKLLAELAESRSGDQAVPLPGTLSATSVLRLSADPDGYAADLARPMPRPPSRAARFGTRFHQWVEHYFGPRLGRGGLGQQQLVDPDDLPDRQDGGTEDEAELRELCEAFAAGRFGASTPYAVEAPFSLLLGGRLVRGRIDAVYRLPDDAEGRAAWQVVDWKTSRLDAADPLQLALYRLAWAEVQQVPLEQVDAVFYHVRSDRVVRPRGLGDRAALEALLVGGG